jgi:hypothetical protein
MEMKEKSNQDSAYKNQNTCRKPGTWLRVQLLSGKVTQKFKIMPALFSKHFFFPITVLDISWLFFMMLHYTPHDVADLFVGLSACQIGWWLLGVAIVSLFHECGHVSALLYCGGIPEGVGVSMHYLLPKGWSEINDMWKLSQTDCLYVDSGGVYFQTLLSLAIYTMNVTWLNSRVILTVCVTSVLMAVINLIPNSGSDGYWLVKDAFGIEDVSQKAKSMFRQQSDGIQSVKPGEKKRTIILLITRNIALIYLLTVVVTVLAVAAMRLFREISSFLGEISLFSPSMVSSFLSNSLSSMIVVTIVSQNVVSSICQMSRGKKIRSGNIK